MESWITNIVHIKFELSQETISYQQLHNYFNKYATLFNLVHNTDLWGPSIENKESWFSSIFIHCKANIIKHLFAFKTKIKRNLVCKAYPSIMLYAMACCPYKAMLLSQTILTYDWINHSELISQKFKSQQKNIFDNILYFTVWLFIQLLIQVQIEENIKAPCHWTLWGEFTGGWWIPHTKGQ